MRRFAVGVTAVALLALIALIQPPAPAEARGPFTLPFPTTNYLVTQGYWTNLTAYHEGHPAYDLVPIGTTAVTASAAGTATVHWDANCGPDTSQAQPNCDDNVCGAGESYGRWVEVDHGDYHVLYTHLSSMTVSNGQQVTRGQQVGVLGSAGCSNGPHIHFQVRHLGEHNVDPGNPKSCNIATALWASCPAGLKPPVGRGPNPNGDGPDDVILYNQAGQAKVSLSGGTAFGPPIVWGTVATSGDIPGAGDFDGDGKDDAVAFNWQSQAVVSLSGEAGFESPSSWGTVAPWGHLPTTGDFNGDGLDDLVNLTTEGAAFVAASYGAGFETPDYWGGGLFSWGDIPSAGDFNGDGKDDLIFFKPSGQAFVAIGASPGFFPPSAWGAVTTWGEIPAVGDFNGDAKADVITFNSSGQGVVALSSGAGFAPSTVWGYVSAWGEIPAVGDFNGDGRDDAITFSPGGYAVVSLSNGNGFNGASAWSSSAPWGDIPGGFQTVAWQKIFRDADLDLACNPGIAGPVCSGTDNCVSAYNRNQANYDGDTEGDACDADDDADGVLDLDDLCPLDPDPCGAASGDVDCDGEIDSVDALRVLRGATGLANAGSCWAGSGDVNCSGGINSLDALLLLRHVAALPLTLPAGCPPIGQ